MLLKSLKGSRLAIGSYPHFFYNASNGGGKALVIQSDKGNIQHLKFDPKRFSIPSLNWRTTKIFGLPLLPGLDIKMCMNKLEGSLDHETGEMELYFESEFIFSLFLVFRFPSLSVKTKLTTGKVKSNLFQEEGMGLRDDGKLSLVGISTIQSTGNRSLDVFLRLPSEALAVLQCELKGTHC